MSSPATFAVIATFRDRSKHTMGVGVQSFEVVRKIRAVNGVVLFAFAFSALVSSINRQRSVEIQLFDEVVW